MVDSSCNTCCHTCLMKRGNTHASSCFVVYIPRMTITTPMYTWLIHHKKAKRRLGSSGGKRRLVVLVAIAARTLGASADDISGRAGRHSPISHSRL
eukprot:scaffold55399_cov31-Tisochrysis_lutea.AAC.1